MGNTNTAVAALTAAPLTVEVDYSASMIASLEAQLAAKDEDLTLEQTRAGRLQADKDELQRVRSAERAEHSKVEMRLRAAERRIVELEIQLGRRSPQIGAAS